MQYEVTAKKRENYPGFRRSGIFFPSDQATILDESQMTDAILCEPMLIVEALEDRPKSLEEMTVKELVSFAVAAEIELPKNAKKVEILAAILARLKELEDADSSEQDD